MTKEKARKDGFARRKLAFGQGSDAAAQLHLSAALAEYRGHPLAGYMPIRTEIDPLPVMAGWNGVVGVPVIQGAGHALVFHRWTAETTMVAGPFGAQVPQIAERVVPRVLIVPLVAFDDLGYRLGYGGGFYDRTLEGLRAQGPILAIGFAYSAQRTETVPIEPTDQQLDAIVTEQGVRWFGA